MENTEPALSLEAATDIMSNPANPQHAAWKAGDREVSTKIEGAYKAKYGDAPANQPTGQAVELKGNPDTMPSENQAEGSGELSPQAQENLKLLQERWGDSYQENADYVNLAAETFGIRENAAIMLHLEDSGLADDPQFLDLAHQMGRLIANKRG